LAYGFFSEDDLAPYEFRWLEGIERLSQLVVKATVLPYETASHEIDCAYEAKTCLIQARSFNRSPGKIEAGQVHVPLHDQRARLKPND